MTTKDPAVKSTPSLKADQFMELVTAAQPRLAVFDCDGTLWAGDSGEGFFDWELERQVVPAETVRWARARYSDYKAGKVSEDDMCGEMVTMHRGLTEARLVEAANQYFTENFVHQIFPEMRELVRRLRDSGCEVWAVSSTNEWVIRSAMKHCGIEESNVLAATVAVENGQVTDRLIRVPSGAGKPRAIQDVLGRSPDAAFGNSRWDLDMLKMARRAFAVNPNPDLEAAACELGWHVYWPDGTAKK